MIVSPDFAWFDTKGFQIFNFPDVARSSERRAVEFPLNQEQISEKIQGFRLRKFGKHCQKAKCYKYDFW
jgi:hypothetical protein